jgi:hypothetical protein
MPNKQQGKQADFFEECLVRSIMIWPEKAAGHDIDDQIFHGQRLLRKDQVLFRNLRYINSVKNGSVPIQLLIT